MAAKEPLAIADFDLIVVARIPIKFHLPHHVLRLNFVGGSECCDDWYWFLMALLVCVPA